MAHGVFQRLTHYGTPEQHPLIANIDSCGTGAYHAGDYSDPRTISVLKEHGITDYKHKSRKVKLVDFKDYDYVLGMDADNVTDLKDLVNRAKKKGSLNGDEVDRVFLFGAFGGKSVNEEIDDPWYGRGGEGFSVAYEQVTRFGTGLLKRIEMEAARELGGGVP